jgi:hypothetical protein
VVMLIKLSDAGDAGVCGDDADYSDGSSVADPDLPDPYVYGPPGSGSVSQRYGSGSFYHQVKIVINTLIPIVL